MDSRAADQRLFRIVRAILLDDDAAEGETQDAYVRAYASLDQFAGRAQFSTWLTKIAIYGAFSRLRKRNREQEFPASPDQPNQGIEAVKSSEPDPEQQTLRHEAASFLEQAVDALPDIYRSVFVLREIETMTTAETASCLDLTEDTVKVRLLRARQVLRKELYTRPGATSSPAFAFMGKCCDLVVKGVFEKLRTDAGCATLGG